MLASALAGLSAAPVFAQVTIPQEYAKTVQSAEAVGALGTDLFGDQTNLYTGATSFSVTDVSLRGNNPLPVAVGRRFAVIGRSSSEQTYLLGEDGMFADWDLEIPHLHAVFAEGRGWQVSGWDAASNNQRCSLQGNSAEPPLSSGGGSNGGVFDAAEYWSGNNLYIPGIGDQEMLVADAAANSNRPADGKAYPWVTHDQWYFSCLPTTANGIEGEAFLARAPDGTRYYFDWFATRRAALLTKAYGVPVDAALTGSATTDPKSKKNDGGPTSQIVQDPTSTSLGREEVWILPTRIEDRFGNAVTYTYDGAHPWRLLKIAGSDGRQIVLTYNAAGRIATVSDGAHAWNYAYGNGLTQVTLPDQSKWLIDFANLRAANTRQLSSPPLRQCEFPASSSLQDIYTGTLTHPSGAVGVFGFQSRLHGRSYVPKSCLRSSSDWTVQNDYAWRPKFFDAIGIVQKKISGAGGVAQQWDFAYGASASSWAEDCTSTSCVSTKIVEVSGPGQFNRYTFGTKYGANEGKLLKRETGSDGSNLLRSTAMSYVLDPSGQAYPAQVGASPYSRGDGTAEKLTPIGLEQVTQDGVTFSAATNAFDAFARPLSVTRSSSLGPTRTEVTAYSDNLSKWVLGQVNSVTCIAPATCRPSWAPNGMVETQTNYDPITALPLQTYAFGKLQQSFGYYVGSDPTQFGTLATVKDGNDNVTTLGSWKRGIPQSIKHPATPETPSGAIESAVVDDNGWINSVTDENGYVTGYGYDAMGRIASIVYPGSDTVPWNTTTQVFAPVAAAEYGIPAGHWKQTVSTGNARNVTYFDALWRPVVSERFDTANAAGTRSLHVRRYDTSGHPAYASYGLRTLTDYAAVTQGQRTMYDALERVTRVEQDSELGVLATTTAYLTGFKTSVTNARGFQTVSSYLAYDQPSTDWPLAIAYPAGAYADIVRDVFGKPTAVKRRDASGTVAVTRSYVYDVNQQLCKAIEPETGATLMDYDAAGNLSWSAAGQPLLSTACDRASVPVANRTTRSYDSRNRLTTLAFPDGRGNQLWAYTSDGLPAQITTYNGANNTLPVTNAYSYNKRRLLVGESSNQSGLYAWSLGYGYDGNANLASQTYPDALTVTYLPNALGQPTQAGSYATGVSYYPNGAIAQFSYGNGIVHTLTQNARQLPDTSRDAYGVTETLDDGYDFDANGNVAAISDGLPTSGGRGNRTMTYDGLDRLTDTTSAMYGGAGAHYTYDVLDNLKTVIAPGRNQGYSYDTHNRLTNVMAGSASVIGLGYDAQGNLANKNGVLYDFDDGNRLRGVTNQESYRYDGFGRRVLAASPSLGNISSQYSHSGQLIYQNNNRSGELLDYVYLGDSLVAIRSKATATGVLTTKYQHTDALGSPVAVTDSSRNVIERSEYEPYGLLLNRPLHDGPGFTGHVSDAATGLSYMQQRYYDPGIGRFLSVDPVTADGNTGGNFNRYWYANNNPYKFTDPDGRSSCADFSCKTSYIDSQPGKAKGFSPSVNGDEGAPAGVRSANNPGPTITFVNDNPNGASPNLPVTTATAQMVESAVLKSGAISVNVNSTTGGNHSRHPLSNHYKARAVDIDHVNGQKVGSAAASSGVAALQTAAASEPNNRENFGPSRVERTNVPGGTATTVTSQRLIDAHQGHVHLGSQE